MWCWRCCRLNCGHLYGGVNRGILPVIGLRDGGKIIIIDHRTKLRYLYVGCTTVCLIRVYITYFLYVITGCGFSAVRWVILKSIALFCAIIPLVADLMWPGKDDEVHLSVISQTLLISQGEYKYDRKRSDDDQTNYGHA